MQKNKVDVENDWLMAGILHTLQNSTDQRSTSEMKHETGADSTNLITYRLDKLESAGYVQTGQVSMEDWDSPGIPPKTASLTPDGQEFAESVDLTGWDEPDTMARRVDRLEQVVDEQQALIHDLLMVTGVRQDQILPDVLVMRAGYTGLDDAINEASNADLDLNDYVSKWASDGYREIEAEIGDE